MQKRLSRRIENDAAGLFNQKIFRLFRIIDFVFYVLSFFVFAEIY